LSKVHTFLLCMMTLQDMYHLPYSGAICRVIHDQTYTTCYVQPRPISPLI
jgi:hypothetical protein